MKAWGDCDCYEQSSDKMHCGRGRDDTKQHESDEYRYIIQMVIHNQGLESRKRVWLRSVKKKSLSRQKADYLYINPDFRKAKPQFWARTNEIQVFGINIAPCTIAQEQSSKCHELSSHVPGHNTRELQILYGPAIVLLGQQVDLQLRYHWMVASTLPSDMVDQCYGIQLGMTAQCTRSLPTYLP